MGPRGDRRGLAIPRYIRQHAGPFNEASKDTHRFNGHLCRLAEGRFGGFFGWADLTLQNAGGYMGMTKGPGAADLRVVDLHREEEGKLGENWLLIDILLYLHMQGLDVLGRMAPLDPARQPEPWAPLRGA